MGNTILIFNSVNKFLIHNASFTPVSRAMSSDSALDKDTYFCFLLFYETRLFPRNVHIPAIDFRSILELAKSASVYTLIFNEFPLVNLIPYPIVPFKYLNTLCAICKWLILGSCMT